MKTKAFFELLVADLTELEMTDLLECCGDVIYRNKWNELKNEMFADSDKIEDLENKIDNLSDKADRYQEERDDARSAASKALEQLTNGQIEKAKQILSEI